MTLAHSKCLRYSKYFHFERVCNAEPNSVDSNSSVWMQTRATDAAKIECEHSFRGEKEFLLEKKHTFQNTNPLVSAGVHSSMSQIKMYNDEVVDFQWKFHF